MEQHTSSNNDNNNTITKDHLQQLAVAISNKDEAKERDQAIRSSINNPLNARFLDVLDESDLEKCGISGRDIVFLRKCYSKFENAPRDARVSVLQKRKSALHFTFTIADLLNHNTMDCSRHLIESKDMDSASHAAQYLSSIEKGEYNNKNHQMERELFEKDHTAPNPYIVVCGAAFKVSENEFPLPMGVRFSPLDRFIPILKKVQPNNPLLARLEDNDFDGKILSAVIEPLIAPNPSFEGGDIALAARLKGGMEELEKKRKEQQEALNFLLADVERTRKQAFLHISDLNHGFISQKDKKDECTEDANSSATSRELCYIPETHGVVDFAKLKGMGHVGYVRFFSLYDKEHGNYIRMQKSTFEDLCKEMVTTYDRLMHPYMSARDVRLELIPLPISLEEFQFDKETSLWSHKKGLFTSDDIHKKIYNVKIHFSIICCYRSQTASDTDAAISQAYSYASIMPGLWNLANQLEHRLPIIDSALTHESEKDPKERQKQIREALSPQVASEAEKVKEPEGFKIIERNELHDHLVRNREQRAAYKKKYEFTSLLREPIENHKAVHNVKVKHESEQKQ